MVQFITAQDVQRISAATSRVEVELPAPTFVGIAGEVISQQQLSKGLTVRIPYFEGQRVGAMFYALVETGDLGEWDEIGFIETPDGDTLLSIPPERALGFRGNHLALSYFYYEVENPKSPSSTYFAEDEIYWPVVDEAEGNVIPLASVNDGVTVRLRASKALAAGALVSFYWHGSACEASLVKHFRIEGQEHEDVLLTIGPEYLRPNKYRTVRLIYTVENAGQKWTSALIEMQVAGDLKSPVPVYGAVGTESPGTLDPIDEGGGIPMVLSTQGMSAGDSVTFIFSGRARRFEYVLRQTLIPAQIGHDLLITVPVRVHQLAHSAKAMSIVERTSGEIVGSPLLNLYVY